LVVFAAKGFRGGSLNEIAQRTGYTRAGVLHYFPSKEAVLLGLLDRRDRELGLLASHEPQGESLGELLARSDARRPQILDNRDLVLLAHILTAEAAGADHPAHPWVAARHALLRDRIAAASRVSIERGELPQTMDPDALALVLLGAVEGIEAQWLVKPDLDVTAAEHVMHTLLTPESAPAGK
jgi:AcrR family transcriptional regulator